MQVYRICCRTYAGLDGEGARLYGGRWNSPGKPAVYTSRHLSLAVLEYLVHAEFDNLPDDLVWLRIDIPDNSIEVFSQPVAPDESTAAAFGDAWLTSNRTLALLVPSAVLSVEHNVILNPSHHDMTYAKVLEMSPFEFDRRLFRS